MACCVCVCLCACVYMHLYIAYVCVFVLVCVSVCVHCVLTHTGTHVCGVFKPNCSPDPGVQRVSEGDKVVPHLSAIAAMWEAEGEGVDS